MAGNDLLVRVDFVKFRSSGASRSPIGTFSVFEDRVEWVEKEGTEKLVISFSDIKGQRVSPPNKTKTQLQLVLHDDEQHTFAFVNPVGGKEEHVKERDLVKETLQQSLIRHRQIANQAAARSLKYGRTYEMEAKKKILAENKHIQQLYKHLVSSKLISAQDFWAEYYQAKDGDDEEKSGVSGGFLSNIAQSEDVAGVKLNLNVDTIQSIFKTYPAVERKHLELVPHEMTEQQFWSKFFQSHYFHRERAINPNISDPFHDCVKIDDEDMRKLLEKGVKKATVDFERLRDNLEIFRTTENSQDKNLSNAALLVKRCNYHSGRVLSTARENGTTDLKDAEQGTSEDFADSERDVIALDSEELRWDDGENDDTEQIALAKTEVTAAPKQLLNGRGEHLSELVLRLTENPVSADDIMYVDEVERMVPFTNGNAELNGSSDSSLDAVALNELQAFSDSLAELLKHFWMCFPLNTAALEEKLDRMVGTLKNFEANQVADVETRFGSRYVKHPRYMLGLAYSRYDAVCRKKKKAVR